MPDLVDSIETIARTHDIRDVLGTQKKVIVCPLPSHPHKHNTPSFSIFWKEGKQWWRCHGACGQEGDIIDLVGFLRLPGYQRYRLTLRAQAAQILDQNFQIKVVIPEKENVLAGDEWVHYLPITEAAAAYAQGRGLAAATISRFRLGSEGSYLTIPCFEEGRLQGIKMRSIQPNVSLKNRFWQIPGSRQGLFNIDRIRFKPGVVFVVKGEIPCMLLDQLGYAACAPTGGEGGWKESWRTALAIAQKIIVGDNDGPGRALGEKRRILLGGRLVFPPAAYKDVDQWILAEPESAKLQLDRWVQEG